MSAWMVDPLTRVELPALPGERPAVRNTAAHWLIERDEAGTPIRMRFVFCDDPECCPPFRASTEPPRP